MFTVGFANVLLADLRNIRNKKENKIREATSPVNIESEVGELLGDLRKKAKARQDFFMHGNVVGKGAAFEGPFGKRECVYFDNTASGKALRLVEEWIMERVLPFYANTHTTVSFTSFVMSTYREQARSIVRAGVGASEDDTVLFCGTGTTTAIHKLIHCLDLGKEKRGPLVFVGPFEHHSNLLPWRETGAEVINIPETEWGQMDLKRLESELKRVSADNKENCPIFGCFSAGSNVTGALTDDIKVTKLLHKYGGLCFWDYAAAAPHARVRMNPGQDPMGHKDALYFSGHKFLGGPQTPGVLVIKNDLFRNPVPHNGGGGTVFFVTPERHAYLMKKEEAEEGGTPGIVESIRLGAVFAVRNLLRVENIVERETFYTRKVLNAWRQVPGLIILGNTATIRLPIVSFLIHHKESGYFLHQNFVVALLNDLFGIQCRGGCMCAGPYAQILLGIDLATAAKFEDALSHNCDQAKDPNSNDIISSTPVFHMIYRPGFTRISLPAEASPEEIDFLIGAVALVAEHGWKLLAHYSVRPDTGIFQLEPQNQRLRLKSRSQPLDFLGTLLTAQKIFHEASKFQGKPVDPSLHPQHAHLRWFMLPSDADAFSRARQKQQPTKSPRPFIVKAYDEGSSCGSRAAFGRFTKDSIPYQIENASLLKSGALEASSDLEKGKYISKSCQQL